MKKVDKIEREGDINGKGKRISNAFLGFLTH